ncbi:metallopeptidase family protein [Vallicoccus soli]|uniref:Metallopeptidase family protein n=1 Tax=Vallicoccus soli TaxID=2339232 RepID=A0A3A3ZJ27_9ACTN|nr:metallopeptidase family protein [Vallicoccus soli]
MRGRRRDRRGRGVRGPLSPPEVPLSRSRAERFDDLVLDAVERLERDWSRELADVEFAVEEVPPAGLPAPADPAADPVPLGRSVPAGAEGAGSPARVVVFRRPVEARAPEERELALLVHEVVVEQVAELLGLEPETVDPDHRDRD